MWMHNVRLCLLPPWRRRAADTFIVVGISLAVSAAVSLVQVRPDVAEACRRSAALPLPPQAAAGAPAWLASVPHPHQLRSPGAPLDLQCCTCNLCGLGKIVDVLLAGFGVVSAAHAMVVDGNRRALLLPLNHPPRLLVCPSRCGGRWPRA